MKNILILFFLLFPLTLTPQTKRTLFDYDYSRFTYDGASGYLEIYYSFAEHRLKPVKEGEQTFVKGYLKVSIKNIKKDSVVVSKEYKFKSPATDSLLNGKNKSLIGTIAFVLDYGDYSCTFTAGDESSELISTEQFSFTIYRPQTSAFFLSDIQLASAIKQGAVDENSVFYKNTYEVIPNPSTVYGEGLPVVFFYTEIYDLNVNVKSELLKIEHVLLDSKNTIVLRKTRHVTRKNPSIVEAGAMNISKIPSGTYTLAVIASDTLSNLMLASSKKIFIFNPSIAQPAAESFSDADFLASEFAMMGEEELNETFDISKYLAKKGDVQQWESLSELDAKRSFLFNFWTPKDKDASTPVNEFKRDYFKRVNQANAQFSTFQKKGFRTERGRVLLLYGEPSEIERYPNQIDSKPYEIWQYHELEGGAQFVFADLTGFSDYQLLHSTLRGELRDDNWQRKVSSN